MGRLSRLVRTRYLAPCALVGFVGIVGVLAFSPGPGSSSAGAVPTTTLPTLTTTASTATPVGQPTTPSLSEVLQYGAPSNQTGIFYVNLPEAFVTPGQALFAANCSSCHGPEALGTTRGPNLQGLGAGTVDFWVSTGRMPLADSSVQATRKPPRFNRLQTLEIAAWVQSLTPGQGTKVPVVNTNNADLEAGNTLFTLNCAACHTITGAGDAAGRRGVRPEPAPRHPPPDRRGHPVGAGQHAPLQPRQHDRHRSA